jgi:hypothetical protein
VITLISNWEKSGNGFGQQLNREFDEDGYGHKDVLVDGDDRSSFVNYKTIHPYHLYLWDRSDNMGVLKNVICVLSNAVSADCENIPMDLSKTQKKRGAPKAEEETSAADKKQKKQFREGVMSSLKNIGDGLLQGNVIHCVDTIRIAISREEDKVERAETNMVNSNDPAMKERYQNIIDHHGAKICGLEAELAHYMKQRDGIIEPDGNIMLPGII